MSNLIEIMRSLGRRDALTLRANAQNMTETEIIASEYCVPPWNAEKDYSSWPTGAPVTDEGQVWILLQPHNASYFEGRPSSLRSLWGLAHTTDPKKAKPWVDPLGTSGLYKIGECYIDDSGKIFRCLSDTSYDAASFPGAWEEVSI